MIKLKENDVYRDPNIIKYLGTPIISIENQNTQVTERTNNKFGRWGTLVIGDSNQIQQNKTQILIGETNHIITYLSQNKTEKLAPQLEPLVTSQPT